MTSNIKCNTCGNIFDVKKILAKKCGDYEVQYFACTKCGQKYQIITTDSKLRDLIQRRKRIDRKFQLMRGKHFRKEAIQKMEFELSEVKEVSERMAKDLKEVGERILMQDGESSAI
ncbi:MAG: hypothetical protein PUA58_05670 [Ruminococcus sp.]|nr:hypothetical protein [Ruminococcus sp.]